jgi:acetylornithine deacetylase
MKCGLVQALLAIRAVQAVEVPLRGPVIFESVIEEECTGNGMLAARLHSGPVDGAVITEPVGPGASVANTGTMWVSVTVEGKPAYVGRAGEYVNAVEKASFLIGRLGAVADEINNSYSHPAYAGEERPFTFSVGTIQGGDWPSNVPLVCRFVCRLSYPPGVDVGTIRGLVERQIRTIAADDPWLSQHPPQIGYPGFQADGWATELNTSLVTTLSKCYWRALGKELEFGVVFGTADARYFDQSRGEQAIYYGPSGGNVHAPDEYVDLDTVITSAKVLAHFIVEWCG